MEELAEAVRGTSRSMRATTVVHGSSVTDWMRFRYDHPHVAISAEMAVRWALNDPVPMREIADACAAKLHATSLADLVLSAQISIAGRKVHVQGWGCDSLEDATGPLCDCLLEQLPEQRELVMSTEVAEEELVPYDGMLSLRLWRL